MKKLLISCVAFIMGAMIINAQTTVKGSKITDDWSVGVQGGFFSPAAHHALIKDARPVFGLTVTKQITPVIGLSVEGMAGINAEQSSSCAIDMTNVSMLANVNLNNFFSGYKGKPRTVEFVAVYGFGWGHAYLPKRVDSDANFLTSKAGLSINFNLGAEKAWQFNLKPAIAWAMSGNEERCLNTHYDINTAVLELTAGVTYKFKNSNGTHNFVLAKLYDQAEVDGLNAKINDLRSELKNKENELQKANATAKTLQEQLNDCRNKTPQVVKETNTTSNLESVVTFAQGKSSIASSQYPNVERIATYLKNHKGSKVVIKGYASPEGSAEINAKLALNRANAVKSLLTKKYKISPSRILAEGQGVGNMFSEPDWNRVAISTLSE